MSLVSSKSSRSLVFLHARAARLTGREGARKRKNYLHPLSTSVLVASSPFSSPYFSSLQKDILLQNGAGCAWSCAGVTGPGWGVSGAVLFAPEEAKAAEVQVLPDDSM